MSVIIKNFDVPSYRDTVSNRNLVSAEYSSM